MKNILYLLPLLILASCGSDSETKKTNDKKSDSKKETASEKETTLVNGTHCFESKIELCSEAEGKFLICKIQLDLNENQVAFQQDCKGCASMGSEGIADFIGTRSNDTLEMEETYLDGATKLKSYSLWVLKMDSLYLIAQSDVKADLKPKNKFPLMIYLKKNLRLKFNSTKN